MVPVTMYGERPYTCRVKNYFGLKLVNKKYYKRLVKTYKYACKFLPNPPAFKFAHIIGNKVTFKAYCKLYNAIPKLSEQINPRDIPTATGKLRERQMGDLKYAMEIIHLLEENGLKPFIDGGTALGAVRHGGFIPWDDDVDVGLVGEEFEKAKQILKQKFIWVDSSKLKKCNKKECLKKMFMEHPNQTFVVEAFTAVQLFKGESLNNSVNVDLLPYQYYSENCTAADFKALSKEQREIIETPNITAEEVQKKYKILKASNPMVVSKSSKIAGGIGNHGAIFYNLNVFLSEKDVFPLKTVSFEGYQMPCVANLDRFLHYIYGDYMKLPRDLGMQKHFQGLSEENEDN